MTVLIPLLALTALAIYGITRMPRTTPLTPSPTGSVVPPRTMTTVPSRVLPSHVTVWIPEADVRDYIRSNAARVLVSAPAGDGGYYVTVTR
jgi:hypothetical protein